MTKRIATPKGIAGFSAIVKPFTNKQDGKKSYILSLRLNPEDSGVKPFLSSLKASSTAAFKEAMKELKAKGGKQAAKVSDYKVHLPYEKEYDQDGNETGWFIVKFKSVYQFKDKDGNVQTNKIPLFDAKKNPIKPSNVAHGSILKVSFTYSKPWTNASNEKAGLTLYISAVQVLELQESSTFSASDYGFEEEDGFDSNNASKGSDNSDDEFDSDLDEPEVDPDDELEEEEASDDILPDDDDF